MQKFRSSAPSVRLAMGAFFVVVGVVLGSYGIVGLGVVVALAGYISDEKSDESI